MVIYVDWRLDPEKVSLVKKIKDNDIIRPLYKLLVITYLVTSKTVDLKFIFGGYYYTLIKEAQYRGLLKQELGKVELTEEGRRIASILYSCLQELEKKERENN